MTAQIVAKKRRGRKDSKTETVEGVELLAAETLENRPIPQPIKFRPHEEIIAELKAFLKSQGYDIPS